MPLDGTIGGLVGKLDVLRHLALAEHGPDYRLADWLHERTRLPAEGPTGHHASARGPHARLGKIHRPVAFERARFTACSPDQGILLTANPRRCDHGRKDTAHGHRQAIGHRPALRMGHTT